MKNIRDNKKLESTITNDFQSQSKNLKERLEQRKNKKLLSTSDCTEAIETVKNHRGENEMNKSTILVSQQDTSSNFNFKALMGEDDKSELDVSFDRIDIKEIKENSKNEKSVNISLHESFINSEINKGGAKHKQIMSNINTSVNGFMDDFMFLFYDQIFQKFFKDIQQVNEEKFMRKYNIYESFQSQISEMELLMKDDNEHSNSISIIVENLKEDKEKEIKKLDEEYDSIISMKLYSFKNSSLKNSLAISTIQEKFKIDMLNTLNDLVFPKLK